MLILKWLECTPLTLKPVFKQSVILIRLGLAPEEVEGVSRCPRRAPILSQCNKWNPLRIPRHSNFCTSLKAQPYWSVFSYCIFHYLNCRIADLNTLSHGLTMGDMLGAGGVGGHLPPICILCVHYTFQAKISRAGGSHLMRPLVIICHADAYTHTLQYLILNTQYIHLVLTLSFK